MFLRRKNKIIILLSIIFFCLISVGTSLAITESAEVYFTSDSGDPYDKQNEITEATYGETFNVVGINFDKSQDVQIFLNDEYVGTKSIEDGKFVGKLKIPRENGDEEYTVKIDGQARGEKFEEQILVKVPNEVPTWAWILLVLVVIGLGVYYIYLKLFRE